MDILDLKELIEESQSYAILITFLKDIVEKDVTYDIKDKIKDMLKYLGEE